MGDCVSGPRDIDSPVKVIIVTDRLKTIQYNVIVNENRNGYW